LKVVKKNVATKLKLYMEYKEMHVIGKNPDEDEDAPPLKDKTKWEARLVL
jgi:hypothetical protein